MRVVPPVGGPVPQPVPPGVAPLTNVRISLKRKVTIAVLMGIVLADVVGYAAARTVLAGTESEEALEEHESFAASVAAAVRDHLDATSGALAVAAGGVGTAEDPDAHLASCLTRGFQALVATRDGRIVARAGAAATDDALAERLALSSAAGGAGALVTADGVVTAADAPDGTVVVGLLDPRPLEAFLVFDFPVALATPDVVLAATTGDFSSSHALAAALDNPDALVARVPVPELGAEVLVVGSHAAVEAHVSTIAVRFLVISTITYALVAVFALFVVARSLAPLEDITRAAREICEGREDLRIALATDDELQVLAEALTQSAGRLAESRRAQAAGAEALRLAAEEFEVAMGTTSRALGEATEPDEIARLLAEGVLRLTDAVACEVEGVGAPVLLVEPGVAAPSPDRLRNAEVFPLPLESGPARHLRVVPRDASLTEPERRKVRILVHQAALACQRAATLLRLREQQRMIVQTEKLAALGSLTAGVAHEVNNPLAYLIGNEEFARMDASELAEDPRLPEDARARLAEVATGASRNLEGLQHIRRIVASLREFSRSARAERRPEDLAPIASSALVLAQDRARKRQVALEERVESLPPIPAAKEEIGQILLNLVLNGIDAAGAGGKVTLTGEPEGDEVVFRVTDTGPGIPREARPRIFNPFFTTKRDGVGLGLSISHKIATDHGGSLAFEDGPGGVGTTFVLRLPVREPPAAVAAD